MMRGIVRQRTLTLLLVAAATVIVAAPILGHAVVHPGEVRPGAYERFVLRVPNERDVPTTRVELAFPDAVRVVSFADVPGWDLVGTVDSTGRITHASWTGTLPVQRFVEFPFVAVTPDREMRVRWDAIQFYANGERVEWAGPENSATPASFTVVRAAKGGIGLAEIVAGAALFLALTALGLALRAVREERAHPTVSG